jgi:hypothetical protein
VPHPSPISVFLVWPPQLHLSTEYNLEYLRYSLLWILFLLYVLLMPNIVFRAIFWNVLSLWFSLNVRDQVSLPCKTTSKIIQYFWLL